MLASAARLLRLLSLLQSRAAWTGGELVERLAVTRRTLRRDVDRLRSLGYPVDATPGPAGGYRLGAGASLPPLMLANDEGLAVAVALHAAAVTGIEEPAQRALGKIEAVLPLRLRTRLTSLRRAIVRAPAPQATAPKLTAIETLARACDEHLIVSSAYRDRENRDSERRLEPQRLVLADRRWYLVAWDRTRDAWRTFRVDRLEHPLVTGERFVPRPPPEGDALALVAQATSWMSGSLQAQVTFHAPIAVLAAKIPPAYGRLTPLGPRRCRFETGGSSCESIAMWLGWTGVPFTVASPPALARHVHELGERLLAAAPRARRRG